MRTYPIGRRDPRRHAAARHAGGQGREDHQRQPGRGHDRPELQLRQVQRHLVRLLGGRRPSRCAQLLQARLGARVHRRGDLADRRAHLEPRPAVQPARGRRGRRRLPAKLLLPRSGAHTDGPSAGKAIGDGAVRERRCRSTTSCAAGTRTACPPRPSSPSSASTSASRAGWRERKGEPMPHVMISSKKCTGCHMCELACSAYHEGAYRPVGGAPLREVNPTTAAIKGHTCLQTGCAKCQEACPQRRHRDQGDHASRPRASSPARRRSATVKGYVLVVDEEKCTNCGECYDVCPTGVIHEHPDREVAFKCDLCDGDAAVHRLLPEPARAGRRPQGRQEGQGAGAGLTAWRRRTSSCRSGMTTAERQQRGRVRGRHGAARRSTRRIARRAAPPAAHLPRGRAHVGRRLPQRPQHQRARRPGHAARATATSCSIVPPISGG